MPQLGEILSTRQLINPEQLGHALRVQKKSGGRLGDILVGEGIIGYYDLYHSVAEHYGLPFADLIKTPPLQELLDRVDAETCLWLQAVPWQWQDGKVAVAVCDLTDGVKAWAEARFGEDVRFVFTSPFDIRRVIERHFAPALEVSSRLSLWKKRPHMSARVTMPPRQRQIGYGLLLAATASLVLFPAHSAIAFIILCHAVYTVTMLFKGLVFAHGTAPLPEQHWQRRLASLDEASLPVYTVLVPMYREAGTLPRLLESMGRLDYPTAKLDIKLVLESDDRETFDAACKLKPHYHFDIIRVPPGDPRTKPRACNYALRFARGELITVFDVDDLPERTQLKKAVYTFRNTSPDTVCLQARLNYYNANRNLLTRFFSLEYTMLFHFMLYGLERLGMPIPLGGTSNHIAIARLKDLGEWDPYNVTEDADLGMRLSARGLKTAMLDSYTMEEAPEHAWPWIRQRSRWIKGYMQTWLVHMRDPARLYRALGLRGFIGFQCFVGLPCFAFLTAPVVWALSLLWLAGLAGLHQVAFPAWLVWLTVVNLALNIGTHWYLALYCAILYRKYTISMLTAGLAYPFYLVLHSIASYKALWQLFVKPHFWEKTVHGLATYADVTASEHELVQIR